MHTNQAAARDKEAIAKQHAQETKKLELHIEDLEARIAELEVREGRVCREKERGACSVSVIVAVSRY